MQIRVIATGKIKEKWLQAGIDEYKKRLSRYCKLAITTVPDTPDHWPAGKALQTEADLLLKQIKPQSFVIALDLQGSRYQSVQLAGAMDQWFTRGGSEIVFVIGGSNGLDRSVIDRAQETLCLSDLTFTHQMARMILLEQCYRGFRILRNEPYHK